MWKRSDIMRKRSGKVVLVTVITDIMWLNFVFVCDSLWLGKLEMTCLAVRRTNAVAESDSPQESYAELGGTVCVILTNIPHM